jgi:hypothetical protein
MPEVRNDINKTIPTAINAISASIEKDKPRLIFIKSSFFFGKILFLKKPRCFVLNIDAVIFIYNAEMEGKKIAKYTLFLGSGIGDWNR